MKCPRLHELPSPPAGKTGWPWTEETPPLTDPEIQNTNWPKISIITPSYGQGHYIEETIRSILLQGYPNLEYIIMDGGSKDNTVEIIKKYEPWITYWVSEKDKGQSEAINKGFKKSTGDVINWLNSDDYYKPGALLSVGKEFAMDPALKSVIGEIHFFGGEKEFTSSMPRFESQEKTAGYAYISQPAMFFTTQAHREIGLLNEELRYCMDIEWWIKFLLEYGIDDIKQIPDVMVEFRLHEASKTVASNDEFTPEAVSIYYSIAKQFGFDDKMKVLEKLGKVNKDFNFELPPHAPKAILSKVLDYYLMLRGEQHYALLETEKARLSFNAVNLSSLSDNDRKQLKMLQFRNNFIPKPIIKLLRHR